MDRRVLRALLADHGSGRAVVAMLERHACRLEQLPSQVARREPEALARALRSAQQLYGLDAVTVGDGGDLLVEAASVLRSADPSTIASGVLASREVAAALDAFRRVRAVLGDRAGIVVVLPAPRRLVAEAGLDATTASAVLVAAVHAFGEAEPDAFVLTGNDDEPDPTHDALAGFYGSAMLRVGGWTTPGVAVWEDLVPGEEVEGRFLVVTPGEIDAEIEPAALHARLAAARADRLSAASE